jgi:hypothetical protein
MDVTRHGVPISLNGVRQPGYGPPGFPAQRLNLGSDVLLALPLGSPDRSIQR